MTYRIVAGNLFDAPRGYCIAHCISADFALGAGVAKQIDDRYEMRRRLIDFYQTAKPGECLPVDEVYNLVTKNRYFEKPTYASVRNALESMRDIMMMDIGGHRVAMPLIGCGLDKLEWNRVEEIIKDVFADTDFDIVIYDLKAAL